LAIDACESFTTSPQSVIKNKSDFMAIVKICGDIKTILEGVTEDNLQGSFALSQLNMWAKSVSRPQKSLTQCSVRSVNRINSKLASKLEQSRWERLWSITIDRNDILGWEKELDSAIRLSTVRFRELHLIVC